MSQLFTTEMLPAADRIDAWRWNAQQICGDCRIKLPKASFHGSIEVRTIGGLKMTRFSSSPLAFWKWPADVVRVENRFCIVITQISGLREYLQNGASILLKAGDSTVIDVGQPWCSTSTTHCARLYLRVPRWMMENRLRSRQIPTGQRICGSSGLGATLSQLAQSLYEEAEHMSAQESEAALDAYFGVLAGCITGAVLSNPTPVADFPSRLREQIHHYVEAHLSDPALAPQEIALALGISVRHLHRLFSAGGTTMGNYLRIRRLEACRSDLANPRLRDRTITEIAFNWGFSDSAHFSHAFTKEFGESPRHFRAKTGEQKNLARHSQMRDLLHTDAFAGRYSGPN